MRRFIVMLMGVFAGLLLLASAALAKCESDSVQVGPVCVDKYEASVWQTTDAALIKKIKKGTATLAGLTAGGTQRGIGATDDYPCSDNGNDCDEIFAVSIPGVKPSANITWFQAQQACMNSGKRLLTNAEWQGAAAGTPDPGTDNDSTDCNITDDGFPANDPVNTGSRSSCVSRWGAFDMVGNLWEWVADWVPRASTCGNWAAGFGSDVSCMDGAAGDDLPGALFRGGNFDSGANAGVFAVNGFFQPSLSLANVGFRCGR